MIRSEIRDYVLDRLSIPSSDTTKVTQINNLIGYHYLRLCQKYKLNRTSTTITASAATVTLPTGTTRILSVANENTPLRNVTEDTYLRYLQDGTTFADDLPAVYVREGMTQIRIYPVPTSSVTLTILHEARPTALSADGDTPTLIPQEYHMLLGELTIAQVALSEEEPGLAAGAKQMALELENDLRSMIMQFEGPGPRVIVRYGYDY